MDPRLDSKVPGFLTLKVRTMSPKNASWEYSKELSEFVRLDVKGLMHRTHVEMLTGCSGLSLELW